MEFSFFSPDNLPPGLLQQIQQQHDLHHMSEDDAIHRRQEFFDSLTKDQMLHLRAILGAIGNESPIAIYLLGHVAAYLRLRHNLCGCGTDHSSAEGLGVPDADEAAKSTDETPTAVLLDIGEIDRNRSWEQDAPHLLHEYNLRVENKLAGATVPAHLVCDGCDTPVISLKDRMLRPPGVKGCESCKNKAKWG